MTLTHDTGSTKSSAQELPELTTLLPSWRAAASPEVMELCQRVWRGECRQKVWLLGRNEAAEILLAQGMQCTGVIDDYTSEESWGGLPLRLFNEIAAEEAVVVNCVQCNQPVEAGLRIRSAGRLIGLTFSDFYRAGLLPTHSLPAFSANTHRALSSNPDLYRPLWDDLHDQTSRQSFADVLCFRLTTDPCYLEQYSYRPKDQYFEDFLALPSAPVFIDAGAYQGETSLEFASRYPGHGMIHAFEPSHSNAEALLTRTTELPGLQLHRVGLSDVDGVVRFASQLGSASRVSDEGDAQIKVIRLDNLDLSRADLIKMDLEGGELKALIGGVQTIQRCMPRLAIAAYHQPEDFALLHQTMGNILASSTFYLRHYTSGWAETVLFAVPSGMSHHGND